MTDKILDDEQDPLKLGNQLCFLLYTASRKMTAAYRPLLNELGLTYPQYLVMMVLWEFFGIVESDSKATVKQKEGMKVGALSEKLQLDNGTLTPLLKRLEQQGLVTRTRDSRDERVVRIDLTEVGVNLRLLASKVPERLLCESGLSGDQFKNIYSDLSAVLRKIPGLI